MPLLILVVAGIVLLFVTSYTTLAWVLIGLGVGLTLLWFLIVGSVFAFVAKANKHNRWV